MNKRVKERQSLKKTSAREQVKRRNGKRKTRIILNYILTFIIITGVSVFLSLTVLFKTEKIEVQGDTTYYTQEEIIEKSGVKNGSNLFLCNAKSVEKTIQKSLPYIEKAKLIKMFPNKIIIQTENAQESSCFETETGYAVTSGSGKALRMSKEAPDNIMAVKGVSLKEFCIGEKVEYENIEKGKMLENLLQILKENDLLKISEVDFTSATNVAICYEGRININFGLYEDVNYKIRTAAEIINSKLGTNDQGVLDLSTLSKDNRSYFSPKVTKQPDC